IHIITVVLFVNTNEPKILLGQRFDSKQAFYLHFDGVTTSQLPEAFPETTAVMETQTVLNKLIAQEYLLEATIT
ncbi:33368_t:CDS:1, partial [Racocetra persica]